MGNVLNTVLKKRYTHPELNSQAILNTAKLKLYTLVEHPVRITDWQFTAS